MRAAPFGNPADSGSPVALRPRLATGVLFRGGRPDERGQPRVLRRRTRTILVRDRLVYWHSVLGLPPKGLRQLTPSSRAPVIRRRRSGAEGTLPVGIRMPPWRGSIATLVERTRVTRQKPGTRRRARPEVHRLLHRKLGMIIQVARGSARRRPSRAAVRHAPETASAGSSTAGAQVPATRAGMTRPTAPVAPRRSYGRTAAAGVPRERPPASLTSKLDATFDIAAQPGVCRQTSPESARPRSLSGRPTGRPRARRARRTGTERIASG